MEVRRKISKISKCWRDRSKETYQSAVASKVGDTACGNAPIPLHSHLVTQNITRCKIVEAILKLEF